MNLNAKEPQKDRRSSVKRRPRQAQDFLDFGAEYLRAVTSGERGSDERTIIKGLHGFEIGTL